MTPEARVDAILAPMPDYKAGKAGRPSDAYRRLRLEILSHVRGAAAQERERCARLVEERAGRYPEDVFPADGTSRDAIAGTALRRILPELAAELREEPDTEEGA